MPINLNCFSFDMSLSLSTSVVSDYVPVLLISYYSVLLNDRCMMTLTSSIDQLLELQSNVTTRPMGTPHVLRCPGANRSKYVRVSTLRIHACILPCLSRRALHCSAGNNLVPDS